MKPWVWCLAGGIFLMTALGLSRGEAATLRVLSESKQWLNTERPLTVDDLKGRIILLDFWTFCCINCIHVIPELHALEKTFGEELTVIGVHSAKFANERDTENIRSAILRYDIEHPVINDSDFTVWQKLGARGWPTLMLINPDGMIDEVYSGEGNGSQIEKDVRALLARFKGRINTKPLPLSLEKSKHPMSILKFPGKLSATENYEGKPALAVSDSGNNRVLIVSTDGTIIETIGSGHEGSDDGVYASASFNKPQGVLFVGDKLYIADTDNHKLRVADLTKKSVSTLSGTGERGYGRAPQDAPAKTTALASPWDLALYPDADHLAIAMAGTHQLWSYDIKNNTVSVLAGNGRESIDDGVYPFNSLSQPSGVSASDGKLYFVDSETSSLRVLEKGTLTTLIGTGLFDFGYKEGVQGKALMQHSLGLHADESGIYIADSYNHSLRRYDVKTGFLHNYAGNGTRGDAIGKLGDTRFNEPNDIEKFGDKFYVTDTNNHRIRVIDPQNQTVSELPIMPQQISADMPAISDFLPNAEGLADSSYASGKDISFTLKLKDGWKINKEAPSTLALFERDGAFVQQFTLEQIASKHVTLPPLKENKDYVLQGTFYFCEDKDGALCLIKSLNASFNAKPSAATSLTFSLN